MRKRNFLRKSRVKGDRTMKRTEIRALYRDTKEYAGKEITVAGWIRNLRDSKVFGFIELNKFDLSIDTSLSKARIKNSKRKVKILNLFAYTGAATMACAKAGAEVVQVDASKGMTGWAKENMKLCNLEEQKIRFIQS